MKTPAATRTAQDIEAAVLMAVTLAAKRRPAPLQEVVAAADLVLGMVPYADKLAAAVERLSGRGLIAATEEGFVLTPAGHDMMARQPRKARQEELLAALKDELAAWRPRTAATAILLDAVQLGTAIRAHQATRKAGRGMLMPKPDVTRHFKVDGHWRRATKGR